MVAGPAGAFICSPCIGAAADIAGVIVVKPVEQGETANQPPPPELQARQVEAPAEDHSFIDEAVLLAKALGWSLSELRSLSPAERRRALAVLDRKPKRSKR